MEVNKPVVTTEVAKAHINIALAASLLVLQKIQDEANILEINEDNLQAIGDFIAKTKKVDKVIEEKHKEGKAPSLQEGRNWDAAKNSLMEIIDGIRKPISIKYTTLCSNIDKRRREEEQREQKKKDILQGIENNVISFSSRIAACATNKELISIESIINLEKSPSRKDKYAEFQQQAIEKYDEVLKPIIIAQKEKIKEKEAIVKQLAEATLQNNVEVIDTLNEQMELVEEQIQQNKITVQESALNQSPIHHVEHARVVFPTIKARRVSWEIELVDADAAIKKAKDLLDISLNKEKAKGVLQTLKDAGTLDGKEEFILNGIRYFQKTLY